PDVEQDQVWLKRRRRDHCLLPGVRGTDFVPHQLHELRQAVRTVLEVIDDQEAALREARLRGFVTRRGCLRGDRLDDDRQPNDELAPFARPVTARIYATAM